jgi:hypothetical protein
LRVRDGELRTSNAVYIALQQRSALLATVISECCSSHPQGRPLVNTLFKVVMPPAFPERNPAVPESTSPGEPVLSPPATSMVVPRVAASAELVTRVQARTLLVFAAAFACLGFALGELTGFSAAQGISQSLLTAVFGFVGGVLLSYAGFRRLGDDGRSRLDPSRVAAGVAGLSLGLALGLPAGVYVRCNRSVEAFFLGEPVLHSQCLQPSSAAAPEALQAPATANEPHRFGLQAGQRSACTKTLQTLNLAFEAPGQDAASLRALVSDMIKSCQLDGP